VRRVDFRGLIWAEESASCGPRTCGTSRLQAAPPALLPSLRFLEW
jgi:hypothetical protein